MRTVGFPLSVAGHCLNCHIVKECRHPIATLWYYARCTRGVTPMAPDFFDKESVREHDESRTTLVLQRHLSELGGLDLVKESVDTTPPTAVNFLVGHGTHVQGLDADGTQTSLAGQQ